MGSGGRMRWGRVGAGVLPIACSTRRVLLLHRSPFVVELREMREEIGFRGPLVLSPGYVFEERGFTFHNYFGFVEREFEPRLNWENQDARWCEIGRWPGPLHFGVEELLAQTTRAEIDAIIERLC